MKKIMLMGLIATMITANVPDKELPIGFTPEEWENRHLISQMGGRQTDPPMTPIRNIAEFERMEGVVIRYPFGISTAVISEMAEEWIVYCLVSAGSQGSASNSMNNGGVNMDNVVFIIGPTDSYWTRDYGPWWVVDGNDEIAVVDHTYNRPRPNDNQAPQKMADHLNTDYYDSDLITAGGNFMNNGLNIGASTTLSYDENPGLDEQGVADLYEDYYGINPYFAIEDPTGTYIEHIDTWAKFLSPTKVLVRSVPESHSQFDEIEATVDYFETHNNSFDEPWEIFRAYTPQNQPYTNSLILNNKVLVPIVSNQWDDDAIAVYEEALPGYEVLGFTGSWESTDALHCRVKGIPDLGMIQFFHNPIDDQDLPANFYTVNVTIVQLSGFDLIPEELYMGWKNDSMDEYEEIQLTQFEDSQNYSADIPSQAVDTEVKYYIHAADESGRMDNFPIAGYLQFDALGGIPSEQGDVNLDGSIDVLDIVTIVGHILGTQIIEGYGLILADVNEDGVINVLDVIAIINIITAG